ncbi:dynein axonemal assembly factor 3 homolog isoform X2 [Cylas formicarius]|nr:dynein axonemal assembly factor 3 homolog isoform X2 [Cylas formicarius]
METVAKQLLLLNTALQPESSIGLNQKTKIYMDLYGNALLRPSAARYLTNLAHDLLRMITDYDYLKKKMSIVTLNLKYKERDFIENLLKFWCSKNEFNIVDCWDRRLRKDLGVRYDSKLGAFDWDLHMRLHEVGGKQICAQEYRSFRLNGVAFSWLESEVSKPNRSLVCAVVPNGERFGHYGYLGDITVGPFVAYGLQCEDKSFAQSRNGQNAYRATDLTDRNLKQIFYEIEHQMRYEHTKTNDFHLGGTVLKQANLVLDVGAVEPTPNSNRKCLAPDDVTINFLSIDILNRMVTNEKYDRFFDIVYFASNYVKYIDRCTVQKITKSGGWVVVENPVFILSNRKKDLDEYARIINDQMPTEHFKKIECDIERDCYFKYTVRRDT